MKIIAFGHRQDVGKDTCGRFLTSHIRQRKSGVNIQTHGFADKVKSIAYDLYKWAGLQPKHYYEEDGKHHLKNITLPKIGKSPRQLWIDLGNAIRDRVYEPTWAHFMFYTFQCDVLIINDLRFPTEANYIREYGGFVVRVDRDTAKKANDGADDQLADYTNWDEIVTNNGTLNDLHGKIVDISSRFFDI